VLLAGGLYHGSRKTDGESLLKRYISKDGDTGEVGSEIPEVGIKLLKSLYTLDGPGTDDSKTPAILLCVIQTY
jgi:hypothetical protein